MFKGQLFVLLVIDIHASLCVINDVYDTGEEVWKLYKMIDNIESDTFDDGERVDELLSGNSVTIPEIQTQIGRIHEQFKRMEASRNFNVIQGVVKSLPSHVMLFQCWDTFQIFSQSIEEIYREFSQHVNDSMCDCDRTMDYLTSKILLDVETHIALIRQLVTNRCEFLSGHQNLISAIVGYASAFHTEMCDGPELISSILVHLFKLVNIVEMKVDVMLAFMNIHLYNDRKDWKDWNFQARKRFEKQLGTYVNVFAQNIETADMAYLRACDPINGSWIRDTSFYELEGTFQTTIFRYNRAGCERDSCNNIWFNEPSYCGHTNYDSRSGCGHTVAECTSLSTIQACVLDNGPHKFLFVNSSELGFLGKNRKCKRSGGYKISDGINCDETYAACACNCYSDENKISLAIIESNVKDNRVIIGLRFLRKDRVLFIQPQEGTLDVNGHIRKYSQRWVPVGMNIKIYEIHPINRDNKVFFLDDLRLPASFVLTGVKFDKLTRGTVTGFALKIFGVPFRYKTGKVVIGSTIQVSKQASNDDSGEELLFTAVNSADTKSCHVSSLQEKTYVSLKQSTLQSDFGQSTLPFFDAAAINANPPTALGGLGIFHKGVEGYAGFIALRVYGIKYAKYFQDFQLSQMRNNNVLFNDSSDD